MLLLIVVWVNKHFDVIITMCDTTIQVHLSTTGLFSYPDRQNVSLLTKQSLVLGSLNGQVIVFSLGRCMRGL